MVFWNITVYTKIKFLINSGREEEEEEFLINDLQRVRISSYYSYCAFVYVKKKVSDLNAQNEGGQSEKEIYCYNHLKKHHFNRWAYCELSKWIYYSNDNMRYDTDL